ncbi:MAG: hypothetical protein ACLQJR_28890 [Stellaceae bacterium]
MVALVFLVDLIVFADLARAELGELQAKHARRAAAARGTDRARAAAEHAAS